ncbi:hypothetical protein BDY24DRAFT_341338, partial [Mrakia frigida]|uniref:uncharacterized protein n=1 Tax=Mrakia frigida TaxID=29902 RepID=UPI003FCC16B4
LVLLTLTFPRLRIIWSSSPFATADIFKDLKVNHSEPSAEKAILIGSADGEEGEGGGGNTSAQELLRSLPGVSGKNYRHIMNSVESVKDFCELSLVKMQEIMGTDDGKTAYTFLHRDVHEKVDG